MSEPVGQIKDFRKTIDLFRRGIAAGHGRVWKKNVTDKRMSKRVRTDNFVFMVFRVYSYNHWLVVWNMNFMFHFIYGKSSFPLTNSIIFQDGHIAPPTRS